MHVYSLLPSLELGYILLKDNRQTYCPFVQPFIIPGKVAGVTEVQRMSCNTTCPLCNLQKMQDKETGREITVLTVECGNGANASMLEVNVADAQQTKPMMIVK